MTRQIMGQLILFALFVLVPLAGTQGQERPEDYPGQGGGTHRGKPPDGWFCNHADPRPAHRCDCQRKQMATKDDPMCEFGEGPMVEDPYRCKVACHPSHCHCGPIDCVMPPQPAAEGHGDDH